MRGWETLGVGSLRLVAVALLTRPGFDPVVFALIGFRASVSVRSWVGVLLQGGFRVALYRILDRARLEVPGFRDRIIRGRAIRATLTLRAARGSLAAVLVPSAPQALRVEPQNRIWPASARYK